MSKENVDDAIDKLFKGGMGGPVNEPVYRETDWDAMEQMLEKRKKRGGMIFWLPLIGSAAALVLLFLGWWLYKPLVVNNNSTQHASIVQHPKGNTGNSGGATVQAADNSKHKILNPADYAQSTVHPVQGKKSKSFLPLSAGGGRRHTTGYASNAKVQDKRDLGTVDANKNKAGNDVDKNKLIAYDGKNTTDKKETNTNNPAASIAAVPENTNKKEVGKAGGTIGNPTAGAASLAKDSSTSAANNVATTTAPKVKAKAIGQQNPANRAIFAIGALASSDLNGTSSFQGGRVGGNFGALFSVSVKKWTFSTGAMYSIKPYQVGFENYHTGYTFKTNPSSVGANCRMIDIPLNVNYQVYSRQGNKVTVGSGLSSYIILREDYTFNYSDPYAQGPATYSVINRNRNIFGILNLDATYEHQINSRFGIAFQPYLKLPFSNVGASQVRLQTAGVAVGLNWNLNPFKKPN